MAVRARQPAPPVHGRRRLGAAPAVGHGDRELRRDGRRLSRGLPHEPGPEHAPDAARRARAADLSRPREPPGHRGHPSGDRRRSAPVDRVAPGVPGRQQRRVHGPVRVQGQRQRRSPTTRRATRATCCSASRTARTSQAVAEAGIVALRPRARRRARGPQPRRPARPRGGQPRRAGPRVAQRRGRHGRRAGARWATGSAYRLRAARRQPGRDRSGGRDRGSATRSSGAARSSWAAATSAASWAGRRSASARRRRRRCGSPGRTASRARGSASAADGFAIIERGAAAPLPWTPAAARRRRMTTRRARLARIDLPDFGAPGPAARAARRRATRSGSPRLRARAERSRVRPARRVRGPRAQRQPLVPHRVRPAVRGGAARPRAGRPAGDPRRQRVPWDGRRRAAADARPPVPGLQPADAAARPVAAARARSWRGRGSGAGRRVGVARLEAVRGPVAARGPRLHRGRAARARRAGRPRRERERPPGRPGRRAAGHQRRRPAGRVRACRQPDVATASARCSTGSGRA